MFLHVLKLFYIYSVSCGATQDLIATEMNKYE